MPSIRSLGTLTLDLVLKMGGFEQGLDKAGRLTDKQFKDIEKRAKIAGAAIGTALVAGAVAITAAVKNSIDSMDDLSKAAQRANISTEAFSGLAYGAGLADVSVQDLQSSLGKLAKAQADALDDTTDQAKVFKALGISVKDASGNLKATDEVFAEFADRFEQLEGSPEIVAAGMAIFGRSFQNLIPLVKDGSSGLKDASDEAARFGQIVSTEAGQQAEAFNDNLSRLKLQLTGVALGVAQELLPRLLELSEKFVGVTGDATKLADVSTKVADGLTVIATGAGYIATAFNLAGQTLATFLAQATAVGKFLTGDFREAINLYKDSSGGLSKQFSNAFGSDAPEAPALSENYSTGSRSRRASAADIAATKAAADRAKIQAALQKQFGPTESKGGSGKSKISEEQKAIDELNRSYEGLAESLNQQIALFGKTSEASKVRYDTEKGDLAGLDDARKQDLIGLAQQFDQMKQNKELQDAADEAVKRETEAMEQHAEQVQHQIQDMQFENELLTMNNKERARAIALRYSNVDAMSAEGQQIIKLSDDYEELSEKISLMDEFRDSFQGFFSDVLSGTKSVKDAFTDMLDNIDKAIINRISQNWVDQLFGASGTTGSGTSGGGWISTIAGLFGGGKASGGSVESGQFYRVNENGPEMLSVSGRDYLMMGNASGVITPNHKLRGGGLSQTNNFVVQGKIDRRTQTQLAAEAGRRANSAVSRGVTS